MERENIFERGSIRKTYFALALPVTFNMVLSVVYNVADTYFISRTQNTDLVAAVSLCGPIFMIMMAFGNIFGQGGASKISRLSGSGDLSATKKVSSFCFWAAVAVGVLLGGAMLLLHRPLLSLLGTTEETYPYALEYYMTMSAGAPFLTLNFIHMNLLRSEGMSKESMFGSAGGILINIILGRVRRGARNGDRLYLYGRFPLHHRSEEEPDPFREAENRARFGPGGRGDRDRRPVRGDYEYPLEHLYDSYKPVPFALRQRPHCGDGNFP